TPVTLCLPLPLSPPPSSCVFLSLPRPPPRSTLFPYTTLFRSRLYWPLGLVVAVSAIPLFLFSRRFTRTYLATSRRQQDQQGDVRSEEHTSELQSLRHLVCRLLLEKKK